MLPKGRLSVRSRETVKRFGMGLYMVIEPSGACETVAEYWEQWAQNL